MLRLVLFSAVVVAPALALAACAPAGADPTPAIAQTTANPCFQPNLVRNFSAPNEQTLLSLIHI